MKIGIYCGLANNMYLFAHALAAQGEDVCFIRDRDDRYPMSQPIWEDIAFTLPYDEVPRAIFWPWSRWTQLESQLKWDAPKWLYDPLSEPGGKAIVSPLRTQGVLDSAVLKWYARASHRAPVVRKMQSCDALFVSGIEGSLLANASGRPFVIYPYGSDLMIAAGLLRPKLYRARPRLKHSLVRRQLVSAYANAICIGSHEPTALAADFFGAEHFFRRQKIAHIPMPFTARRRGSRGDRRYFLEQLLSELGCKVPSSEYVGFVPSRVDFHWKGQDRLLYALARLHTEQKASNVHLIFSGWGEDFDRARQFVRENSLGERVTFLDCALSKPLLYRFYLSADFVVDQFIVGMCGTSALEAMACGAPLITWINENVERPWGAPPVLQARTTDNIFFVLRQLGSGRIDLEERGRALQEWLSQNYNPATVARELMRLFNEG
jgi:glycosyltransferase involved in cell wall biosynthesis